MRSVEHDVGRCGCATCAQLREERRREERSADVMRRARRYVVHAANPSGWEPVCGKGPSDGMSTSSSHLRDVTCPLCRDAVMAALEELQPMQVAKVAT